MTKQVWMKVVKHQELIKDVYLMVLEGNTETISYPGQFINILIPNKQTYLRRPMSICAYDEKTITLIYKVVGEGTKIMSQIQVGEVLDVLVGLGNGFDQLDTKKAVVIGGGLGVPPLYQLVKTLKNKHVEVEVILGFNSQSDIFFEEEFKKLCPVTICTMDGSKGIKGTALDALKQLDNDYDHYYACGPLPMLKALASYDNQRGYLSYEARMGCGFGGCMGCSMLLNNGESKRVCVEGPVFSSSEVIIND